MNSEWKKVKLGEIATYISPGPFGSQLHQSDYSECGTPVIMPKDMIEGKISENSIARISQYHVNRLKRHKVETGDILYSRRGDVGRCVYIDEKQEGWLTGTGCVRVSLNQEKCYPKFIFYFLQRKESIGWVEKNAVGATMLNLNSSIVNNIPVELPPLPTQRKIAAVLGAYDDLIENAQKQIKLLEEAAMRLYREWFVELRFPGHKKTKITNGLPEGWKRESAESFFEITIGKTPPRKEQKWFSENKNDVPWVSISDMGNSNEFVFETSEFLTNDAIESCSVKVVPKGTVLVSFKLTVGRVAITSKDMCTNEAIAHFHINNEKIREYTYLYLKHFKYDILGNTSAISQAVNSKIIKNMPFVMPSQEIVEKFSAIVSPYFNQIINYSLLIINSRSARDALLPKLMSGEISAENIKL